MGEQETTGASQHAASDAALLLILVTANLTQNLLVPQPWQFVTQPAFAAAAVAVALRSGLTRDALGLGRARVGQGLRWGLGSVAIVAGVLALACAIPGARDELVDRAVGAWSASYLAFEVLVRIPLVTAGPEEVLFRGVVLAAAVRRWGWRRGVVAAALLFGLWHVAPTLHDGDFSSRWAAVGAVVGVVAVTFGAGLVFSWLRQRSGSVLAPFFAHWATNGLALLAVWWVS